MIFFHSSTSETNQNGKKNQNNKTVPTETGRAVALNTTH